MSPAMSLSERDRVRSMSRRVAMPTSRPPSMTGTLRRWSLIISRASRAVSASWLMAMTASVITSATVRLGSAFSAGGAWVPLPTG